MEGLVMKVLLNELNQIGEYDYYVIVRTYKRALKFLPEELERNDGDSYVAAMNAVGRALAPYEWALVGRR